MEHRVLTAYDWAQEPDAGRWVCSELALAAQLAALVSVAKEVAPHSGRLDMACAAAERVLGEVSLP